MELNATFFAQITHFGIAYIIVRYVLIRPVLSLVISEEREKNILQQRVMEAEQRVKQQALHNDQTWDTVTRTLRDQRPPNIVGETLPEIECPKKSQRVQGVCDESSPHVVRAIAQSLVERIVSRG